MYNQVLTTNNMYVIIKSNNVYGGAMKDLKKIRTSKDLYQYEAAKKLEISKDYLNMIENGRKKPGRDLLIKMSNLYEISIEDIFLAMSRT